MTLDRSDFEWTDPQGNLRVGRCQLTEMKHRELMAHLPRCDKPMKRCKDCYLLYWNIGTDAWDRLVTQMANDMRLGREHGQELP